MTKNKFLGIAVIALIALNIGMLGFHFMKKAGNHDHMPPHKNHRKGGPKNYIIKQLHFDDSQIEAYEALIEIHKSSINDKESILHQEKQHMYDLLYSEDKEQEKHLLKRIGRINADIDSIHFEHFKSIRDLCRKDQQEDFKRLSKELARLFSPHKPPGRH